MLTDFKRGITGLVIAAGRTGITAGGLKLQRIANATVSNIASALLPINSYCYPRNVLRRQVYNSRTTLSHIRQFVPKTRKCFVSITLEWKTCSVLRTRVYGALCEIAFWQSLR